PPMRNEDMLRCLWSMIFITLALGCVWGWRDPVFDGGGFDPWEHTRQLTGRGSSLRLNLLAQILSNNLKVFGLLIASGVVSAGLMPLLYLFLDAANFGRLAHLTYQSAAEFGPLLSLVVPHAVFELTAFVLATASLIEAAIEFCKGYFVGGADEAVGEGGDAK